jgi:hypothetical protein
VISIHPARSFSMVLSAGLARSRNMVLAIITADAHDQWCSRRYMARSYLLAFS